MKDLKELVKNHPLYSLPLEERKIKTEEVLNELQAIGDRLNLDRDTLMEELALIRGKDKNHYK